MAEFKQNQFAIVEKHRVQPRHAAPRFEVSEERGITSGECAGQFTTRPAGFCQAGGGGCSGLTLARIN
jgi:hypothetical protein